MPPLPPSTPAPSSKGADLEATLEAESVFVKFRQALPEAPLQDVTLHDDQGELLFRDPPDSKVELTGILREAADALGLGIRYPFLEFPLDAKRTSLVLPVWAPDGSLAALATLVLDTATLDRKIEAKFLTPPVRAALKAIGAAVSGLDWPSESAPLTPAAEMKMLEPAGPKATAAAPVVALSSAPAPVAPRVNELPRAASQTNADLERITATLRDEALELHVQPLVRLRSSARTRRFEILLRKSGEGAAGAPQALLQLARDNALDSMLDRRVISQLMAWLVRHRAMWKADPPLFSVNLSSMAIAEDHFYKFVELCVRKAALPAGLIGFEIAESACREKPECAARAVGAFRALGCPVVIDDFTMHSDVLPLLNQPGIKLVKLDARLTIGALGDRMREARVVSLVQAMRVLGMQTVAKRVEDEAEREWLTALGVDFVQSFRFMPPEPLEGFEKKI